MQTHSTLQDWVAKKGGASAVSRLLKVRPPRVQAWTRKEATPKPRLMQALVRVSKGELSLDSIINSTVRARPRKAKTPKRKVSTKKAARKTSKAE